MNRDTLKGNWKQMKGKVRKQWGKFTDDEVERLNGDYDKLVGKIQEKYGHSREEAESQINDFMKDSHHEKSA